MTPEITPIILGLGAIFGAFLTIRSIIMDRRDREEKSEKEKAADKLAESMIRVGAKIDRIEEILQEISDETKEDGKILHQIDKRLEDHERRITALERTE